MRSSLEDILLTAGEKMLSYAKPEVYQKSGHANFVTEADVAVQALLEEQLSKRWPEAHFLAEEEDVHHLSDGLTFVIDPIDGTTNYMRRRRASVISIGAVENGKTVFGAIYDPYHKELYHAERGKGAYCNDERLHVSSVPFENALIALGSSPYESSLAPLTARCMEQIFLHCADIRRSGTAARDLCDIAAGRCEASFEWQLQPWDYCAGSLLVEEAGGQAGNILGGGLTFTEGIPFLCATPACYEALQHLLLDCKNACL